jgi:hypothetical protein
MDILYPETSMLPATHWRAYLLPLMVTRLTNGHLLTDTVHLIIL